MQTLQSRDAAESLLLLLLGPGCLGAVLVSLHFPDLELGSEPEREPWQCWCWGWRAGRASFKLGHGHDVGLAGVVQAERLN